MHVEMLPCVVAVPQDLVELRIDLMQHGALRVRSPCNPETSDILEDEGLHLRSHMGFAGFDGGFAPNPQPLNPVSCGIYS